MSDIDTALVDRLKALDPNRPIREADIAARPMALASPRSSNASRTRRLKTRATTSAALADMHRV